jgi:hypothetical protein
MQEYDDEFLDYGDEYDEEEEYGSQSHNQSLENEMRGLDFSKLNY